MKIIQFTFFVVIAVAFLPGCRKDNYDPPPSMLAGRLLYNGDVINVEYNRVPYELYQYGFGKVGPINGSISPEGAYSQLLFDGDYKFVFRPGQGPFLWGATGGKPDTLSIAVKGNTVRDIEVQPYYMIRDPQFVYSGGKVTGTCRIEQVITGANEKTIEKAALFINKTVFVGNDYHIARMEIAGGTITDPDNVQFEVTVPALSPAQNYVFAAIGMKATGVEDWIFTAVQKIQL